MYYDSRNHINCIFIKENCLTQKKIQLLIHNNFNSITQLKL